MITLFTGLPGNGKTLFALTLINEKAVREGREVFYDGIKDLKLPWTKFKGEEWRSLPVGAIIVIDEAQKVFPRHANGAKLPEHYTDLAEHRHQGYDINIITQGPKLIDMFVRELVGQHFHVRRKFGFQRATIYEWDKVNMSPMDASQQKSAVPMKWSFNKKAYDWYKSAEVHTVKVRFPMKVVAVGILAVAVFGALYLWVSKFGKSPDQLPAAVASAPGALPAALSGPTGEAGPVAAKFDPVADARQFVQASTPRIEGLPHTAPKYDGLTVPTRVPLPAACIQIGQASRGRVSCKCFTQQGTAMDVPFNMCVSIAQNGYFQDFDAERDHQGDNRSQMGAEVLARHENGSQGPSGERVATFEYPADLPRVQGRAVR